MTIPTPPAAPQPGHLDQEIVEVLGLAARATSAYQRPDLHRRIKQLRERVDDPQVRVLVVGEFKHGKSSLVNGLIAAEVCPVDDDVATSVATFVGYADEACAVALSAPSTPNGQPHREPVDIEDIAEYVSELGNPANEQELLAFEVGIPRELLRSGLVLIDTPGVGGLGSAHSATTIGALPSADAVILVSDAAQEYTEPELAFVEMARDLVPSVHFVLTKIDFYPAWRRILALNQRHLAVRGFDPSIVATSASLRRLAIAENDRQLNHESGYPDLIRLLREGILADAERITRINVSHNVVSVCRQLTQRFVAERRALDNPERREELVAELEKAREQAAHLRSRAARWQQTLSDGFADLAADADHDLRSRTRLLLKQTEEGMSQTDPGEVWDQIEQWLYRAAASQVAAHYATITTRARALAQQVAQHFADEQGVPPEAVTVRAPIDLLRQIDPTVALAGDDAGPGAKALTAMRGSYGGMIMVGMLSGVVGLGMMNPISLGFGAMLGRKAVHDQHDREVAKRRHEALQACRSYLDEVSFLVTKDARDTLRGLQRGLRDLFSGRAQEIEHSTAAAIAGAQRVLQTEEASREARRRDVEAEITRLQRLADRAAALASAHARSGEHTA